MFIDRWMNTENVAYMHNGILFSSPKKVTAWMNLEDIMLSSNRAGQRLRHYMTSCRRGIESWVHRAEDKESKERDCGQVQATARCRGKVWSALRAAQQERTLSDFATKIAGRQRAPQAATSQLCCENVQAGATALHTVPHPALCEHQCILPTQDTRAQFLA